jgi:plastocyanin
MRRLVVMLMVAGLLAIALPAHASVSVQMEDFRFNPRNELLAQGAQLTWFNSGTVNHTSRQDGPLRFWNTGQVAPSMFSSAVTLWAAGRFTYHCNNHPFMTGIVRVPVTASTATLTLGEPVTITMSSSFTFKGYTFDVQRRRDDKAWVTFKTGVGTASVETTPKRVGEFRYRARIVNLSGATGGWSPVTAVSVTV